MAMNTETLQVALAANGFYPRAFRWQGRLIARAVGGSNQHVRHGAALQVRT